MHKNPLQKLFPGCQPLKDYVIEDKKRKRNSSVVTDKFVDIELEPSVELQFPKSDMSVNRYLGADAPVLRGTGPIRSAEDEESLMRMWWESRSDIWQWLSGDQIQGKMILRDLTMNRKAGVFTLDIRKYSGNEF